MARAMSVSFGSASRSSGDSLRLPRGTDEGRDDIAVAIAEGHHLVALQMLVATVPEVVAAFLRRRRGAIAVNHCQVEQAVIMKPAHRASKDRIHATISLPATERPVDARMMDFGQAFCIPLDRQHLPLTAHIQHLQDVVEGCVQIQRRRRSAPAKAQMRQDKFFELRQAQFHGNCLPAWVSGHSMRPKNWTLTEVVSR